MIHGVDGRWRLYVGQSAQLKNRIKRQHQDFRYRRDNSSLHNRAMDQSKWDNFVIAAVLPATLPPALDTPEKRALLLNVLEMWCALLFKTLQLRDLIQWSPPSRASDRAKCPWFGLNMQLPIEHAGQIDKREGLSWTKHWADVLAASEDPVALEYRRVNLLRGQRQNEEVVTRPFGRQTATRNNGGASNVMMVVMAMVTGIVIGISIGRKIGSTVPHVGRRRW